MGVVLADKSLRWYLAGPMTGIPQFNFPLFDRVSQSLREDGYTIISPAELDDDADRAMALASEDGEIGSQVRTWGDFLSRDVKIVADEVDGIIFLPGWFKSRGARLEAFTATLCGHSFAEWVEHSRGAAYPMDVKLVKRRLYV